MSVYSYWAGDVSRICFGIEEEFFILQEGKPPARDTVFDLIRMVTERLPASRVDNFISRMNSEWGEVSIHSETGTHIMEVSYPPLQNLPEFRRLRELIVEAMSLAAHELDIQMIYSGTLEVVPADFDLYVFPPARLKWFQEREKTDSILFHTKT